MYTYFTVHIYGTVHVYVFTVYVGPTRFLTFGAAVTVLNLFDFWGKLQLMTQVE
jgi:hypothetical protein